MNTKTALSRLTIIAPFYNESDVLPSFHKSLCKVLREIKSEYELECHIIYVDDGSDEDAQDLINSFETDDIDRLKLLKFSRNFGKEAALLAGIDHAEDSAVIFIDTDGQHPANTIIDMVQAWKGEGYDIVYAYQAQRQDGLIKSSIVKMVYNLINTGNKVKIKENASDFRLISPRALRAIRQLPERSRFFKGLSVWVGFKQKSIPYTPLDRIGGTTKWSPLALLSFALTGIVSFSLFPLRLLTVIGFLMAICSIAYGTFIIFEVITSGVPVPGYPSLIVSNVFLGGILTFMLGLLAEYVGQILNEVKQRPVYIILEDKDIITTQTKEECIDVEKCK